MSETSTLPEWLLSMKRNLENSKVNLVKADKKIDSLSNNVAVLTKKISETYPVSNLTSPRLRLLSSYPSTNLKNTEENNRDNNIYYRITFYDLLHIDVWSVISSYLDVKHLVRMEASCKEVRGMQITEDFFNRVFRKTTSAWYVYNMDTFRASLRDMVRCSNFIRNSKKRSGYTQAEKVNYLELLFQVTSELQDFDWLSSLDPIRTLTTFLKDEYGATKDSASGILANLLCWESRSRYDINKKNCLHGMEVTKQLQAADGKRLLTSLLTSPSAQVNIIQTRNRHKGNTSSVRGLGSQRSARALVNWFCPELPVPSDSTRSILPLSMLSYAHEENIQMWQFLVYHKSGALKEQFIANMRLGFDKTVRGEATDSFGHCTIEGKIEQDICAGPCFYFHFTCTGRSKAHLSWVGYYSNGLVSQSPDDIRNQPPGLPHSHSQSYLLRQLQEPLVPENEESNDVFDQIYLRDRDIEITHETASESSDNCWGSGFYGVWESTGGEPHFALQSGGVWRAIPLS